jgi:NitT/TauT family transport system substrate-binding protein
MQKNVPVNFFLFADYGYPPYGTTMVTTTKLVAEHPDVARRFVKASLEGWKSYVKGDPSPANALIKADNPNMSDAQIAFGIKRMNELQMVDGGDAKTMGIGIMTEQRWKATYDLMVQVRPAAQRYRLDQGFHDTVRERPEDYRRNSQQR